MGGQGSGRKSRVEIKTKKDLVGLTEKYILENFERFSQAEKLKIALTIQSKAVKQKMQVEGFTFAAMVQLVNKNRLMSGNTDKDRLKGF